MAWYEEVNFYQLKLTNGNYEYWTTPISFIEAKEMIGNQSFIKTYSHGVPNSERELNTKVIESIKDITESERKSYKEHEESKRVRLKLIEQIRKIHLSRFYQWKLGLTKKPINEPDWFDKEIGMDIDYLMKWNEDYLEKLLEKCKRKSLEKKK